MRQTALFIALAAGAAAAHAETGKTPIALEWQRYTGGNLRHVYVNTNTGERVFSSAAALGAASRGNLWTWSTSIADPCQAAAGVLPGEQGIGVFTGIMSEPNGAAGQANAVRLWQDWFDAPADTLLFGMTFQYYTGLQDPGFTPGDPDNIGEAQGLPGYDMIMVFTENDDPANQSTAVAHSPVVITELPGANDSDGSGAIEFAEGFLWTFFIDFQDTPIELADSDNSTSNPQGSDTDEPGTVGEGFADCGFAITFRQPNVSEGDELFRNNALIDFSNVDLDPVTGIGNPDGSAPDLATFGNIAPTGTGLFAPSDRLETFTATVDVITQWPVDTSVVVEEGEGFGSWDAMEIFDATGADESDPGMLFFFGGFACLTPGGGTDGYENPYSAFFMQFNIDGVGPQGCNTCNPSDIAEPCNVLDLADINAFIAGFLSNDPISDFAPAGGNDVWDLADINAFISSFLAGCP